MEYKGNVTVKIDGLAASAASVVAMAGTEVLMSPTALMMIHNPWTAAIGDSEEMQKAAAMLDEVKTTIINAYQLRTNLSRTKLSNLMDAESFFPVGKAIELGFADGMLEDKKRRKCCDDGADNYIFSRRTVHNSLMDKVIATIRAENETEKELPTQPEPPPAPQGVCVKSLEKRLSLIPHSTF